MTALPKSHGIKGNPKGKQGGWTPEKCHHQSAKLRAQKIWLGSTGPRTPEGKQKSSLNACKPGYEQRRAERLQAQHVRNYVRLNRLFTNIYVQARKTWAELSHPDKAQIFENFALLKNELGILDAKICQSLEMDDQIASRSPNPQDKSSNSGGINDNQQLL